MVGDILLNSKAVTDFAGRSVYSQSQHWCTPPKYVEAVRKVFDGVIELDPCTNEQSIVNANTEYILPQKDGLKEDWNFKTIYINPPYGADRDRGTTIKNWIQKCAETHKKYKSERIALIPVATNTAHWKHYIFGKASAICFLYDTRLKFLVNGSTENKGAPMACCMVYWGQSIQKFRSVFEQFGAVVDTSDIIGHKFGIHKEENTLFSD